jgi:hypothetical protein
MVLAAGLLLASEARAYNSEEHKVLVDMAAPLLRLHPSITLPSPARFGSSSPVTLQGIHNDAKEKSVGYRSNDSTLYSDQTPHVQDNCFWTGYWQRDYNFRYYVPRQADLRDTTLAVPGMTAATAHAYTIGELSALYGDYRRTTHCVGGNCYLTHAYTARVGFDGNTFNDSYWCPDSMGLLTYLKYVGNGLVPPWGPGGDSADPGEYMDAGWWGDEMLRIARINDWHFCTGGVAWYVGMHRLALLYVDRARSDNRYWNHALHYEANALHSLTDLFAFGHVVTSRDRTTYGIMTAQGIWNNPRNTWMRNAIRVGGGLRDPSSGLITLSSILPPIADTTTFRNDYLAAYGGNWNRWALQEADFHNAFNRAGAKVRNLKGESFTIQGDGDFRRTADSTRKVIVESVRASLQALFDAYVQLGQGKTVEQIGARGSSYFAALKSLPIFIEKNYAGTYSDYYGFEQTVGNNFNGTWTRYAQVVDAIAGTHVVPDAGLTCVAQYVDGDIEFSQLATSVPPCRQFPDDAVTPPPPPPPSTLVFSPNFPNPFGQTTSISFALPSAAHVRLELFDLAGAKVATLVNEQRDAGPHVVSWDGVSDSGQRVAAGTYYSRLTVDGHSMARKLTLVP